MVQIIGLVLHMYISGLTTMIADEFLLQTFVIEFVIYYRMGMTYYKL